MALGQVARNPAQGAALSEPPAGADIRLDDLRKTHTDRAGAHTVLNGVSLEVPAGQILALLGPAGCGKTTLLRCIAGLDAPDAGSIQMDDRVLWSAEPRAFVPADRRGLGLVTCPPQLWPRKTVLENAAFALRVQRLPKSEANARARQALALVGLERSADQPAGSLDAESQWFVALAQVLASAPRLVLLDDPLADLFHESRTAPRRRLRHCLKTAGATVILATRSRSDALAQSDAMAFMHGGRILEAGTPESLYFSAAHPMVASYLGHANLFEATVRGVEHDFLLARTPLGTLHCQLRDLPEGTPGTLSIQPEFIRVSRPDSGPGFNMIEGRVQALEFAGEFYDAEIRVNDQVVRTRAAPNLRLALEDAVEIWLDPGRCRFLDA